MHYGRSADTCRKYRYTFRDDGFYQTLKQEAARVLRPVGTGPDWRSKAIQDTLTGMLWSCEPGLSHR